MTQPLVSIIIPTYNRAHLIGETLDSVLSQTYSNWECIVVDDGSTDNTEVLLESYVAKDARFQYHKRPDSHLPGGNGARNYGFEVSKGEFVNWLDSDDLFSANKIKSQIDSLNQEINGLLLTCKWARFNNNKTFINEEELFYKDYRNPLILLDDLGYSKGLFPSHVYLVNRKIIEKSGLWDEKLYINQDAEFFCRVIINSGLVLYAKKGIAYYRFQSNDNLSVTNTRKRMAERIRSWKIINNHVSMIPGGIGTSYINKGKKSCYKKVKRNYPLMLIRYAFFFKEFILDEFYKKKQLINK